MKIAFFIVPFIAILLLFASCSSERNFENRKYLPGFFKDRAGKKEIAESNQQQSDSTFKSDSVLVVPVLNEENTIKISSDNKTTDSVSATKENVRANVITQEKTENQIRIETQNSGTIAFDREKDERRKTNIALAYGLIAICIFLTGVILTVMGLTGILMTLTFVALVFAIAGMAMARKIRLQHVKGEEYDGKGKVIFARVIGIVGIVSTAYFLVVMAFWILTFARAVY